MASRKMKLLFWMIILIFSITSVPVVYFASTQKGARLIVKVLLAKRLNFSDIKIGKTKGNLLKGLILENIEIVEPEELPKGSVLKIEQFHFVPLLSFKKDWLNFKMRHVKWNAPFSAKDLAIEEIQGRLVGPLLFQGIESEGIKVLPQGSILRIKKLEASSSLDLRELGNIEEGELDLPFSDPVIFSANRRDGHLETQAYCENLDLRDVREILPKDNESSKIRGRIQGLHVSLANLFEKEMLSGEIRLKKFTYDDCTLVDFAASFNLTPKWVENKLRFYGEIVVKEGTVLWKGKAIKLEPGKIVFSGDPRTPSLDLKGAVTIENVSIVIALTGLIQAPHLKLISDSPLSQKRLFLMFFVGKSWMNILFAPFIRITA